MSEESRSVLDIQEDLWSSLGSVSVEELITRNLVDRRDYDSILDLIFNEIRLREPHSLHSMAFIEREYQLRFEDLKQPIGKHFEFERLLLKLDKQSIAELESLDRSEEDLTIIPGYRIISEHARGGGGIVYRAIQHCLNRQVAIKVFRFDQQANMNSFHTLKEEAYKISKLFHRNIIQVFEFGECEDGFYIVFPFIQGGSLKDNFSRLEGKYQEISSIIHDAALGVQYAHELGVLHCDITPSNVLLAAEDRPLLTDFGLSKDSEDLSELRIIDGFLRKKSPVPFTANTQESTPPNLGGTLGFMSPEQINGDPHALSEKTDIYGLSAVLYYLLTGNSIRNPLAMNPEEIKRTFPSDCPKDLREICMKGISISPWDRYSSAIELSKDLARFQDGRIVKARPLFGAKNFAERCFKWIKRSPLLASVLLLSVILSSVFIIAILYSNNELSLKESALRKYLRSSSVNSFELGKLAASNGSLSQSIESYRNAISAQIDYLILYPNDHEALLLQAKAKSNLAVSLAKSNRVDLAVSELNGAIAILSSHPKGHELLEDWDVELANFHANLGNQYLSTRDFENASIHYKESEKTRKNHNYRNNDERKKDLAKSDFDSAYLHQFEPNGMDQAISRYKLAISNLEDIQNPEFFGNEVFERLTLCYSNLCFCLQQAGDPREIVQILNRAIERLKKVTLSDPNNYDFQSVLAILYHNLGHHFLTTGDSRDAYENLLAARSIFDNILKERSNDGRTTILLGTCLTNLSYATRKIEEIESGKQQDANSQPMSLVFIDEAIKLLDKQLKIATPTNDLLSSFFEALFARANWLSENNRWNESISAYRTCLDRTSKFANESLAIRGLRVSVFNSLGITILEFPDGNLEQALLAFQTGITECEEFLQVQSNDSDALNNLVSLLSGLGRAYSVMASKEKEDAESKELYRQSLAGFNKSLELAASLKAQGRLHATNQEVEGINRISRANVLSSLSEFELSNQDLLLLIKTNSPGSDLIPTAKSLYGVNLAKMNRLEESHETLSTVLSENADSLIALYVAACGMSQIHGMLDPSKVYEPDPWHDQSNLFSQTMQILEGLASGGFFDDPKNYADLLQEKCFNSIRYKPEFVRFLESLKKEGDIPESEASGDSK